MSDSPERTSYATDRTQESDEDILCPVRLPAAAKRMRASGLFLLTLLSAVDGTLLMLGASGRFTTLGGAVVVGLTVIGGAGTWVAARDAFGGRRLAPRDHATLVALGCVTLAATTAAVWLGSTLGQALTLHVMPKAAGLVMILVGAEVAGIRIPRVARAPAPVALAAAALFLEAYLQWIP